MFMYSPISLTVRTPLVDRVRVCLVLVGRIKKGIATAETEKNCKSVKKKEWGKVIFFRLN